MFDDELRYHRKDKYDNYDFINSNDIERSSLDSQADDYSEEEILRETLIKKGWRKV